MRASTPLVPSDLRTVVLIRTTEVSPRLQAFAEDLRGASGARVAFVIDERNGSVDIGAQPKVSLTVHACEKAGLYCPSDFAWKCGDYALYLGRRRFPDAASFWLIESDVRFAGSDPSDFFRFFAAREEIDFLAAELVAATFNWFWYQTARARDVEARRCFFPVTRTSAKAVDVLFRKRVEQSRKVFRRILWPNDEAFVATTLAAEPSLVTADINAFGRDFYKPETYSYSHLIRGEDLRSMPATTEMLHPVLFGDAYWRKVEAMNRRGPPAYPGHHRLRRVAGRLCRTASW